MILKLKTVLQPLKFFVDSKTIVLDEVVLEESRLEKKTLVNTGLGWKDKSSVGYAISTINEADIKDSEHKIDEAFKAEK